MPKLYPPMVGTASQPRLSCEEITRLIQGVPPEYLDFAAAGTLAYTVPTGEMWLVVNWTLRDTAVGWQYLEVLEPNATGHTVAMGFDPAAVPAGIVAVNLQTPFLLDEGWTLNGPNVGGVCQGCAQIIRIRKSASKEGE